MDETPEIAKSEVKQRPGMENLIPFKPGQSGNPNGVPKGTKQLRTILKAMLNEEIEVDVNGVKTKKKFIDLIIRKLLKKANDGDMRAIEMIFDRMDGKPDQKVDVVSDGQPLLPPNIAIFNQGPPLLSSEDEIKNKE